MNITRGKVAKAQKVVIYGPEGIGKSTLASQFPEPVFIDTEGSTANMDLARLDKPSSWSFLLQQIDWVKQNRPCKTLVIDTIDWAERMCIEHICQTNQKRSIEDFGYGAGYIKLEEELGRFLNVLQDVVDMGINVVLTAHAQIRKFEQPDEMGAYDRYELKLGKKTSARTSALVKEWADMVLFANYKIYSVATDKDGKKHKAQGGARVIYTQHHPAWDAKNRHNLPEEIPMDYSHIAHIFNEITQIENVPVQKPEQQIQQPEQQSITEPLVQTSQPQPDLTTEPAKTVELNPMIPKSLRDLMIQNNVSEEEIQIVVSKRGYYPMGTPITNYDPGFVEGVLVGAWPQVYNMILEFRKDLPF
ncbi:ATP-binding protein [Caldifermentibacillus hisashii]|uniref:ATP-binding protein n=1 Tax=Caldifermentibacillus hisashii TaxID=996558 RepID=UPI0031FDCDCD